VQAKASAGRAVAGSQKYGCNAGKQKAACGSSLKVCGGQRRWLYFGMAKACFAGARILAAAYVALALEAGPLSSSDKNSGKNAN
jgi:hypothetical protein